ncbi:MAG: hypothetical protein M1818_000114 [Claussenomyces sp. TS43310]|nr:MAG: hypothetical protein M1818_000114 [Claussenomyces sp. TS43310]
MESFNLLLTRGNTLLSTRDSSTPLSPAMLDLIIALMVLIFASLALGGTLYIVRKIRKSRAMDRQQLPQYETSSVSNPHRLTITTSPYGGRTSSIYVYDDKSPMMKGASSPPLSPDSVPEIRITFPDEQDESGRRTSGRVVIVKVGEKGGIGLEPLRDEQLPAYEKESGQRFHSIDMDRIGGLKEKSTWS